VDLLVKRILLLIFSVAFLTRNISTCKCVKVVKSIETLRFVTGQQNLVLEIFGFLGCYGAVVPS